MKTLKIAALVASIVSAAHAVPTSFSNTLKGYNGENTGSSASFLNGSGLEPTTVGATPAIIFDADGAKFGEFVATPAGNDGWESRNFLRTTEQGYGSVSFIAYVTAQRDFVPTNGPDGYGAIYFGLGSAEARYYRTPDGQDGPLSNTSTFFRWQAQEFVSWHAGVKGLTDNYVPEIGYAGEPGPRKQGTTRLMMAYDATAKTVTYAIDYNYTAPFTADQVTTFSISAVANEFINGERSSIFFGSNGEVSFSEFSVQLLPPPSPISMANGLTGFSGNSQTNYPSQPLTLIGSGLNASFIWAGGDGAYEKIDFTPSGVGFGNHFGGDGGRNYLRTNAINYATVPFSAYVTVNRTTRESVFFGLGAGARADDGQPDVGTGNASVFLELQGGFDNGSRRVLGGTAGTPTNNEVGYDGMTTSSGPMRLRMDYDPTAKTVVYSIDYSPSGTFVADQTFPSVDVSSIAPEWAGGETSSIYFGGEDGMTFTDFSVVVAGSASLYEQWAGSAAFNGDSNSDGVVNGLAWILGAANPAANAVMLLPNPTKEAGFLTLSFQRVANVGSADLWVEFSNDLGISDPWTAVNILNGPLGGVQVSDTPGSPLNTVVVKIPNSEASPSGKLFARIKATQP